MNSHELNSLPTLIADGDAELYAAIANELQRQHDKLVLIASENFVSPAVQQVVGSVLTNKYAEGYPGKRYYGGCEFVDEVEELARGRACQLFKAEHANVQPHSGSQANQAVFLSLLQPGDKVLSMELAHGGHLTHGSPVNISGRYYTINFYGVRREDELLDYEAIAAQAQQERPKLIICGYSAYSRQIDFQRFREIADQVGAHLLADIAHIAGLVATDLHPSPLPYAHYTTTTTHKTLRGPRGGMILVGKNDENNLNIRAAKSQRLYRYSEIIDSAVMPGIQGGPLMHIIAAKALALHEALRPAFQRYQKRIIDNAQALAAALQAGGLRIISGGTDNHLMLVDLQSLKLRGREAEKLLDSAGITVNKNTIPFDRESPLVCSGIRLGTAALTTRGMAPADMQQVAQFILEALQHHSDGAHLATIRQAVQRFARRFPLFAEEWLPN